MEDSVMGHCALLVFLTNWRFCAENATLVTVNFYIVLSLMLASPR